jgi:hypothetical protein
VRPFAGCSLPLAGNEPDGIDNTAGWKHGAESVQPDGRER